MVRALGIDLGSTSLKACLWELAEGKPPHLLAQRAHEMPLQIPEPGQAVQDPDACLEAVRELVKAMPEHDRLGFSCAMHGLLGLDARGRPITPVLSWADQRSWREAEQLRSDARAAAWAERTGTPIHPMAWPAKLLHLGAHRAARWVGLKEYVLAGLTGGSVDRMDRSLASATGLYAGEGWDEELLGVVGLRPDQLPEVAEPDDTHEDARLGAFVLGAGDGPLSHLGTGARCCLSIGTSGALRVVTGPQASTRGGQLFRYYLSAGRWVQGGAISNGSLVLDWLRQLLREPEPEALLAAVAEVPAGSQGLVALPYLMGERSPIWDARAQGALVGLAVHHGPAHIARAMLEGVIFCLRQVRDSMALEPQAIRVTGGMSRSSVWLQMLADALDQEVVAMAEREAGALGAALLAAPVPVELEVLARYQPRSDRAAYDDAYARFLQLYPALRPVTHA